MSKNGQAPKRRKRSSPNDPIPGPTSPLGGELVRNADGGPTPLRSLLPEHEAHLQEDSGISPEVIAERGYYSATKADELAKLGFRHWQRRVPSLVIPIRGVDGEVATWAIRPDEPRESKGKLLKYEQPKDSRTVLDIPTRVQPLLRDPDRTLWITEGSKKADSAVSRDILCIALSGVWGWRGATEEGGKAALGDWDSIALDGRDVVLAFDSDVMIKESVQAALRRLREFLASRGATVRICLLPPGPKGAKTGLDDFFVRGGTVEQLQDLVVDDLPPDIGMVERRGSYVVKADGVYLESINDEGDVVIMKLMNFVPRITYEVHQDDGVEETIHFRLQVTVGSRSKELLVPSVEFRELRWIHGRIGACAIVEVGVTPHRVTHAVQTLSDAKLEVIYSHSGWRRIGDAWLYLHGGGAIGPVGPVPSGEVHLPETLRAFTLPVPPPPERARECVLASMSLVRLAPAHVSWPILLAVYRAVLGDATFSIFLVGLTGTRKSSVAAVGQQHFGSGFSITNLPANWSSTANATEELLFIAKDALIVIDDFVPTGTDRSKLDVSADRLFRNAANRVGRQRMNPDGSLRGNRPPRALAMSTGECLPRGHSLVARVVVVEFGPGDVDLAELTRLQALGTDGTLAGAMSAFLRWLSPRLDLVRARLRSSLSDYQTVIPAGKAHGRTVGAMTELCFTLDLLLEFAADIGAISPEEADQAQAIGRAALVRVATEQSEQQLEEDIALSFMRQLRAAISAGRAHLADLSGKPPAGRELACGWRRRPSDLHIVTSCSVWEPQGELIGWVDDGDAFLLPDLAESVALRLAHERSTPIAISGRALRKRLHASGFLASAGRGDGDARLLRRKTIGGTRHEVLHLLVDLLLSGGPDQADQTDQSDQPTPDSEAPPHFSMAAQEAASPADSTAPARPTKRCWACKSTKYVRQASGPWVCATCRPMQPEWIAESITVAEGGDS